MTPRSTSFVLIPHVLHDKRRVLTKEVRERTQIYSQFQQHIKHILKSVTYSLSLHYKRIMKEMWERVPAP